MSANTSPIFTITPVIGRARLTGANTTRDASSTTNLVSLITGGTNGTRVDSITFRSAQATAAASSAMVGRVFLYDGTNYRLVSEVAIATATASNTAVGAAQMISFSGGLVLPVNYQLFVGISVYAGGQDQFDVIALAGNF